MTSRSSEPAERSAGRGAAVLMVGTLASRVTGLLRNSLLNQLFDARITDAFTVAWRVPNLFRELLAEGALSNSFVPVYARLRSGGEEARRLAGALLTLLVLINGLLVLAATLAAPWIVQLLLGEAGSVDADLAVRLTRAVFPFLFAVSLSAWAMGILNAEERFFAPAWAPVALNVVTVLGMLLFPGAALALAVSFALGGLAQFLVQIPALLRAGLWPGFVRPWHPELWAVLLLMAPFAVTTSGRQVVNVVATRILDGLPAGSQTAWFNADLFLSLALGVFAVSPALAWYARLSRLANDAPDAFGPTLADGLRFITFLTAPAGFLLLALAEPATRVVFDWTSVVGVGLDAERIAFTTSAVAPLGLAVLPLGLHQLLTRAWYVRSRVAIPIGVAIGFLVVQGAGFVILGPRLGVEGLAWSAAGAAWLQWIVLFTWTARREGLPATALLLHGARVLIAAGLAGGVAWWVSGALPSGDWWSWLLRLSVSGVLGVATYAVSAWALRLPEVASVVRRLRRS